MIYFFKKKTEVIFFMSCAKLQSTYIERVENKDLTDKNEILQTHFMNKHKECLYTNRITKVTKKNIRYYDV